MSDVEGTQIASKYEEVDAWAKELGSSFKCSVYDCSLYVVAGYSRIKAN